MTKKRLLHTDYVPVSTCSKFELTEIAQVLEHADAKSQQLNEHAASHLTF
jgi:hypothetical protein